MNTSLPVSSRLEAELLEQGSVLRGRMQPKLSGAAGDAARLLSHPSVDEVLIAARGSSANAARFAQYALGGEVRQNVGLAAPSLFSDPARAPDLRGAAVLGISQSGQSPDVTRVLAAARQQGRPTVALTNNEGSPLAWIADAVVPLGAGAERSVAATKTYLASVHAIVQIIQRLRPDPERARWLEQLPDLVDDAIRDQLARWSELDVLDDAMMLTVVGRGLDLSTAQETSLKIRELAGIMTEAYSPADLLHGPVAALGQPGALWVIDTHQEVELSVNQLLERVGDLGMRTVLVSRGMSLSVPDALHIAVPSQVPHWVATILAVVSGQAAALHLGRRRGIDLDRPHGLTKITRTL
jgi:glutamine---fructose-6-phosphate transaminase (isomerizing)